MKPAESGVTGNDDTPEATLGFFTHGLTVWSPGCTVHCTMAPLGSAFTPETGDCGPHWIRWAAGGRGVSRTPPPQQGDLTQAPHGQVAAPQV